MLCVGGVSLWVTSYVLCARRRLKLWSTFLPLVLRLWFCGKRLVDGAEFRPSLLFRLKIWWRFITGTLLIPRTRLLFKVLSSSLVGVFGWLVIRRCSRITKSRWKACLAKLDL
ncbi:hypothetical protein HanIR_Chr05g0248301 [Helianthus annuus]|nr:hypothetical protein HanIR_Chr05g0248301 [Helianthus annuus]